MNTTPSLNTQNIDPKATVDSNELLYNPGIRELLDKVLENKKGLTIKALTKAKPPVLLQDLHGAQLMTGYIQAKKSLTYECLMEYLDKSFKDILNSLDDRGKLTCKFLIDESSHYKERSGSIKMTEKYIKYLQESLYSKISNIFIEKSKKNQNHEIE